MLSIAIIKGIINEYGIKELNKRFKLNLPVEDKEYKIINKEDSVRIETPNPITITVEDDVLIITTEYKTYKVIKYYYNKELIRDVVAFYSEDNDLLTLDYIDNGNFTTSRISKTTTNDKNFNQGYYERETTTFPIVPIEIKSHYINNDNEIEEERIIDLANANLYYHHYRGNDDNEYFNELAMCVGMPYLRISGHLRIPDDLLVTSLDRKKPNIIIRGVNTNESNEAQEFYQTIIEITNDGLLITDTSVDYKTRDIDTKKHKFRTNANTISSRFLEVLIRTIKNYINPLHQDNILEGLNRLKDITLIYEHEHTPDINTIDLMMAVIPDHNHLALNMYENLSKYENTINEEIRSIKPEEFAKKVHK